jgi:hypothetical protein
VSALDRQVGGQHYKSLAIQPVEFIMANQMNFNEGNVVKYVTRWREKGGIEDLRKVRHYLQFIEEDTDYTEMLALVRSWCYAGAWWRNKITAEKYITENKLGLEEGGVVRHITAWSNSGARYELTAAIKWADELLAKAAA